MTMTTRQGEEDGPADCNIIEWDFNLNPNDIRAHIDSVSRLISASQNKIDEFGKRHDECTLLTIKQSTFQYDRAKG